jgi:hypothetical protein
MKRRQGGRGEFWSGVLWLCSAFLDCADGELARIGKMQSRGGHLFDYFTDVAVNCGFFLAAGINLYKAGAGNWSIRAGVLACAVMIACSLLAEAYESEVATGERVWEGGWGFPARPCGGSGGYQRHSGHLSRICHTDAPPHEAKFWIDGAGNKITY